MAFEEKTISSELLYDAGFFKMRKDTVLIPGGKTSRRIVIDHNGAVGIAAMTKEGKILLVKQYRKALENFILEIPAGKIDDDEVLAEGKTPCAQGSSGWIENSLPTAQRELKEETGYFAENWRKINTVCTTVGFTNEHIDIYACDVTEKGATDFDEGEDLDLFEVDLKEALNMVLSGEIQDSKTMVAILMMARERGL